MAAAWSPDLFHDEFKEKLQQLVQAKAQAGDVATLQPLPGEEAPAETSAEVIDLTDLLRRSLQSKTGAAPAPAPSRRGASSAANDEEAAPRRKAAATKAPAKARTAVKPATAKPVARGKR
jgi:DNA end-binding protein Ku